MKKTLALFFAASLTISCGDTSTKSIDNSPPKLSNSELLKQEGLFYVADHDGDGVDLHLKSGAHFIAKDKKKLKIEGVTNLAELENREKVEIEYRLSTKAYTTKMAYVVGAKGKITGFLGSEEGSETSQEINLVSYHALFDGNEATFTITGKDKKGTLVEYQSSWSEMNKEGLYGNDFQLNTKSMEALEKSGFYEELKTEDGPDKGGVKLALKEASQMAKILISTITYRQKEMEKIKVIK